MKLFSLFCQPQRLSIAFGMGHGKVGALVFLYVPALYLRQYRNGNAVQSGYSAQYGVIVSEMAVSVKL